MASRHRELTPTRDPQQRFLAKVDTSNPDGCWTWTASTARANYGTFWDGKNLVPAHRFAYRYYRGEIPDKMYVCHHCDNSLCIRPSHLFVGTQTDNMQDAVKKGRVVHGDEHWAHKHPELRAIGSRCGSSKLDDDKVRNIRMLAKLGKSQREIAANYGVTQTNVACIIANKTWKHLIA